MSLKPIFIGKTKANFEKKEAKGYYVEIGQETYYKIENINTLRPFFMSIVSDSNHWMFISSNGGTSAGRKDADTALFPYYTDDKIIESADITGSKTIFQVIKKDKIFLWEPFTEKYEGLYSIKRNLYKNNYGNKIIFEETNKDLGLTFQYQWNSSNLFGFVRKATLINNSKADIKLALLDGIQNILPYGLSADLQNTRSNLVDAYKKNELLSKIGMGIFALSAIIVDKAEPSEALKANIAWSLGIENPTYLISSLQVQNFRQGKSLLQETDIKAEKGAYFIHSEVRLQAENEKSWLIIANVNQDVANIIEISEKLKSKKTLSKEVLQDIDLGTQNLIELAGNADGLQHTADELQNTRHFSNTLFNIMRGGIFDENYKIDSEDFIHHIQNANKKTFKLQYNLLQKLPSPLSLKGLRIIGLHSVDGDFKRLCFEYMPLKFSRRHGDPSRPWNKFSINTRSEIDGSKILDYEGNWRDIFQNWEALAYAYPEFIESMILKFLNASTFDGYNPYRVTKDGFDWETIEENDPWSYIGYWGDHQIIYLLKFLEIMQNHYPNKLADYFDQEFLVYANVPYKIKSYTDILKDPKDTIQFDHELDRKINRRKLEIGADGALLTTQDDSIYKVNFIEKLLATILAKCSNFIPEAGIWMNTQRPEWNDANNALVGNGVSMVTLYHLRRFLTFFDEIIKNSSIQETSISKELLKFFNETVYVFDEFKHLLIGSISDEERKCVLDGLGNAGGKYRTLIYKDGFSGTKKMISKKELLHFVQITLKYLNHSIEANKRTDNLYHAYNLITKENEGKISITHLPEMLEGQVGVLSSGYISSSECLAILDSLRKSALYRKDQDSYILYPNKQLPGFTEKNIIPKKYIEKSSLLKQLLKDGNTQIIQKDRLGNFHFNGNFNNANSLKDALSKLPQEQYKDLIESNKEYFLDVFEAVFNHKSFTGRSGTFFGYEGLGSIYWHMVSKLLLVVQENCWKAIENKEDEKLINRLIAHYYEIKEGIGLHKSPELYGAFPSDPYSHTPSGKGAQQPGMTGQVKEDILSRFGELGISVKNGKLRFNSNLLRKEEFLIESKRFRYRNINRQNREILIDKNSLCFTYCQIPIIYKTAQKNEMVIIFNDKKHIQIDGLELDKNTSKQIFERNGAIDHILVSFGNMNLESKFQNEL